jgi:putative ABC transport system permease protein
VNIEEGSLFYTAEELEGGRSVAIIGYEIANTLFPSNEDPIGQSIKIKNLKYTVIGVTKKEGQSFMGFSSSDYVTIIPLQ